MTSPSRIRLQLAVGQNRLARRESAMLYVPESEASSALVRGFIEASDSAAAARAVKDFVIDQDLTGPAFLLVQWGGNATIVTVFGDIEAETSSRAAPRLSGASSLGLIEHRPDPTTDFEVSSGDISLIDAATELHAGSVLTGAFVLRLAALDALAPPSPEEHPSGVESGVEGVGGALVGPPSGVESGVEGVGGALVGPPSGVESGVEGVGGALVGPPSGVGRPGEPSPQHTWSPADLLADDPSPQPAPSTQEPDAPAPAKPQPAAATNTPLVEARVCACGMASPPTETICRSCNLSIANFETVVVPRPCVAILELEDGDVIDVDTNLSIGRDPKAQPGFDAVVVELPGISRHHIDIVLDGWDILVTDRGSKNGVMVAGEDGVPAQIEPEQAWLVRVGSTLYLGTHKLRLIVPTDEA